MLENASVYHDFGKITPVESENLALKKTGLNAINGCLSF
jgi:hypothetical protein